MRYFLLPIATFLLFACGGEGGSDNDPSTYDTCRITQSSAALASDRARDLSQCWSIQPTSDKQSALAQCKSRVSSYLASEYLFGPSVEFSVTSSSCP